MDPRKSAQDIMRCDLCEVAIVQMYCDFCHVNLCKPCIGEHISDEYDKHKVVPFKQRKSTLIYPKCAIHPAKTCEFQCNECNIPACSLCFVISDTHKGHNITTLSDIYHSKKRVIRKDIDELENILSPTYEEIATYIEAQMANLDGEYEKLSTAVTGHGEKWHREIDKIVNKIKSEIEEIKIQHMNILKNHLDEIKHTRCLIEQALVDLDRISESNEVCKTTEYRSTNKEFSNLPSKVQITMPTFRPKTIETEQLYKLYGSLGPSSTTTEENGYKIKTSESLSKERLEEPELITTINTGYKGLRCITCLNEQEIWTCGEINDMKCFDIQGLLVKTIRTKSGERPNDIAVTGDGDLVYSDGRNRSLNKVKNGHIEEVIRLQGWIPGKICITSSGELLIVMFNEEDKSKVVRYSGFTQCTEKQTIQFDGENEPLFSGNDKVKYLTENKNLDICVADSEAGAVVVVNQAGKLRFRYTGHPSTTENKPFKPRGITTDSQSQILTADSKSHCIHILDQDGHFLCYIDNCDLKEPYGLCLDKNENLFVTEFFSGNVKKIKYLKLN